MSALNTFILAVLGAGRRDDGQTMAEYALILVGVAVLVAGTAVLLGGAINNTFTRIIAAL